jgi:hypothetical protein
MIEISRILPKRAILSDFSGRRIFRVPEKLRNSDKTPAEMIFNRVILPRFIQFYAGEAKLR